MKKSINLTLIGVLTVVSILLALPFTPLRNSFSGITSKYINNAIDQMGVDFKGQIKNARLVTKARSYKVAGLNLTQNADLKKKINTNGNYNGSNLFGNGGNYTIANNESNSSKGPAVGGMGSFTGTSNKNSKNKTSTRINGLNSVSTDLTLNSTITAPKASIPYSASQGGTHPGVDPTESIPSLPIGDGMNSLFIFAAIFAAYKIKNSISI